MIFLVGGRFSHIADPQLLGHHHKYWETYEDSSRVQADWPMVLRSYSMAGHLLRPRAVYPIVGSLQIKGQKMMTLYINMSDLLDVHIPKSGHVTSTCSSSFVFTASKSSVALFRALLSKPCVALHIKVSWDSPKCVTRSSVGCPSQSHASAEIEIKMRCIASISTLGSPKIYWFTLHPSLRSCYPCSCGLKPDMFVLMAYYSPFRSTCSLLNPNAWTQCLDVSATILGWLTHVLGNQIMGKKQRFLGLPWFSLIFHHVP